MTALPKYVADHIAATTGLDVTVAAGRDNATIGPCPRCQDPTLVGLDDNVAAMTARADWRLLTPSDELTALLASRRTYRLHRHGRRLRLRVRDHWQIEGQPAGVVDVVAEHACGQPLGTPPAPPARRRTADTDGVPF